MGVTTEEAIAIFQGQQECITQITDKVSKLEEIVERIEKQNEKNVHLVKTSIGEIRHLPTEVEKSTQNALKDRMDAYIDNLPSDTFKRYTTAIENTQKDLLKTSIELEEEVEKVKKKSEEITDQLKQMTKKFYGLLVPALITTLLSVFTTIYNASLMQNAITTANNVIDNANSTIQQYNSTLDAAIPKIPAVSSTNNMPDWLTVVLVLGGLATILYIFVHNNKNPRI